jgi:dienelactone hydrolase
MGFRVVEQVDVARSYRPHDMGRPIQTLIWYPAASAGHPMRYEDYLELAVSEEDFHLDAVQRRQRTDALLRQYNLLGTDAAAAERIRNEPVGATRDASPAAGRFPVVIYAASDSSSAFENDSLCEYLASHGYIVIASPSRGAHGSYMTDGRIPHDLENTRAQAADISFLIGYAQSLPQADTTRVGVVAYSWGGMASMFAAIADSRILALVDLDGSVRYFPKLLSAAPDITPGRLTAPLLFFADREDPIEPAKDAWPHSFIARIDHADVTEIGLKKLFHDDLSDDSLRLGSMAVHADTSAAQRNDSYAWVARYTLAFLDSVLKGDPTARAFMEATPAANQVPPEILGIQHRYPRYGAASVDDLASAMEHNGYADPLATYAAYQQAHPGFRPETDVFSSWVSSLLDAGRLDAAGALARLWTHVYPQSGDAWAQLGAIDDMNGVRTDAIEHYRRALQLDPHNQLARQRIGALMHSGDLPATAK